MKVLLHGLTLGLIAATLACGAPTDEPAASNPSSGQPATAQPSVEPPPKSGPSKDVVDQINEFGKKWDAAVKANPSLAAPPPGGSAGTAAPANWGTFSGMVQTQWLDIDGKTMELLGDFSYTDPVNEVWLAKKGLKIDGASIPRVFWTFIGGPFEGKYRNASVVHDAACDKMTGRTEPWQKVHLMFYTASLLGGVSEVNAKIIYGAVYHWGPRWNSPPAYTLTTDSDFLRLREYIRRHSTISIDAIEKLTRDVLIAAIPEVPSPILIPAT